MPLAAIDFETIFLGAWVLEFSATGGLNGDSGGVSITLVEDETHQFSPLTEGVPIRFICGDFEYDGIYQYCTYNNSISGNTITVFLSNVVELLNGTQVILADYNGGVYGTPNLINAYGYLENVMGFGGSLLNNMGIPWRAPVETLSLTAQGGLTLTSVTHLGLRPALEDLINSDLNSLYGSGLWQAGHKYIIDFSGIDRDLQIPTYYRVGGTNQSMFEIIGGLYRDSGHDFIPVLTTGVGLGPHTISFKSISRVEQTSLGQIAAYIGSQSNVISSQTGVEFRNEATNVFLVGAQQETIYQIESTPTTIYPFWGYDWDGDIIIGSGTGDSYRVDLNAGPILDIMGYLGGDTKYNISPTEMRMALADYDSWAFFVSKNRFTEVAAPLGVVSTASAQDLPIAPLLGDFIAQDPFTVAVADSGIQSDLINRTQRLYEFIRNYAETYYGRQFLVVVPNLFKIQMEPDSQNAQYSAVPTNAAYIAEGSSPLGLDYYNELVFLDEQSKFHAFGRYDSVGDIDLTSINQEGSVLQNDLSSLTDLYTSCEIGERIYTLPDGRMGVVATFSSPVRERPDSYLGDSATIASVFGCTQADLINAISLSTDAFPVKCVPRFRGVNAVAVPMKSNTSLYGPYQQLGAIGKTQFIRDDQLAPWVYGGYTLMNTAAALQIQGFATNLQRLDTGNVTVPGLPEKRLGDVLVGSGSEITNIDMKYGIGGIETTYKLQNYSPRKGQFTRDRVNYLQRIGASLINTRRNMRQLVQSRKQRELSLGAYRYGLLERTSRGFAQKSPHAMMMSQYVRISGETRICTTVQKFQDAPFNVRGSNYEKYYNTAGASLDTLFLGISNDLTYSGLMPNYRAYDTRLGSDSKSRFEWEPVKSDGYNINWIVNRDAYSGMNKNRVAIDYNNVRDMGLRGPVKLAGWGYDILGKPVPNLWPNGSGTVGSGATLNGVTATGIYVDGVRYSGLPVPTQFLSNEFASGKLTDPYLWPAGPVDIKWDPFRSMYTTNTLFPAYSMTNIPAATSGTWGTGLASIYVNGQMTLDRVTVYNHYLTAIPSGRRMFIQEAGVEGQFFAQGPDCAVATF